MIELAYKWEVYHSSNRMGSYALELDYSLDVLFF